MLGRIFRLLVGLGVLAVAVDLYQPSLIPHGIPIALGSFEDTRTIAAALLGVVGFSFVFSGIWPPARKKRRAQPLNMSGLDALAPEPALAPVAPPLAAPEPAPEVAPVPVMERAFETPPPPVAMSIDQAVVVDAEFVPVAMAATDPEPAFCPLPPAGRAAFVAATEAGDQHRMDGALTMAEDHYDQALELARVNYRAAPTDPQARADLAGALTNIGDVHDELGHVESAISAHEESLKLRRAAVAEAPDDRAALRGLSLGLERLADTRESRGHRSRALDLYRESLPIAARLVADHPAEPIYAKDLETTRVRVAELQRETSPAG
jgi:tetratricopeptide (TPR) repeat protein